MVYQELNIRFLLKIQIFLKYFYIQEFLFHTLMLLYKIENNLKLNFLYSFHDNDAVTSLNDNYYLKILITINKVNSYINTGIKINNLNLSLSVKIKFLLEIVDYLKIEEFSIYHIIDSLLFIKSNKGIVFIAGMEC